MAAGGEYNGPGTVMIPLAAIIMSLFWCISALLIIRSRGYSPGGILLCLACILGGGLLAGLPGAYALSGWGAIADPGTQLGSHATPVACAAIFIGALCGLYLAERWRDHEFPSGRQLLNAMFGFLLGGMAGYVLLAMTLHTWAGILGEFALFPATLSTATLAGSAIGHRLPEVEEGWR